MNFFYTNFCPDELLSLRIFYINTLYHTNICIQTLAYELLLTYYCLTNLIPDEHLRTNVLLMNQRETDLKANITIAGNFDREFYARDAAVSPACDAVVIMLLHSRNVLYL